MSSLYLFQFAALIFMLVNALFPDFVTQKTRIL